jgi:hypothetical protein
MKPKLSAADLMVIVDCLNRSLNVAGFSSWSKETREMVMNSVIDIMEHTNMNLEMEEPEEKQND